MPIVVSTKKDIFELFFTLVEIPQALQKFSIKFA